MTEILGSDDHGQSGSRRSGGERARRPDPDPVAVPLSRSADAASTGSGAGDQPALPVELLGDGWDEETEPPPPGRSRRLRGALAEPGSLAVAGGLCLVAGAFAGPSYRFDAYPFNQGISSLANVGIATLVVHPLHDYLMAAAPSIALVVAAVLTALAALGRGHGDQPEWVRPLAGGTMLAALIVLALLALGAYRTSTYALSPPSVNGAAASPG